MSTGDLFDRLFAPTQPSVDETIARAFRPTWRVWQWRVYRIRGGWEWGWLGQGWNVLRLGKVRLWV